MPTLRMSGAVSLLPLYAFMGHTGTTLTFIPYLAFCMVLNWPETTQNAAILLCTLPMNRLPLGILYELHVQPIVTLYWPNCSSNKVLNFPYTSCCAQKASFTLSKNLHYAKIRNSGWNTLQILASKTVKVTRSVTSDYTHTHTHTHTQSHAGYIHASSFHYFTKTLTEQMSLIRNFRQLASQRKSSKLARWATQAGTELQCCSEQDCVKVAKICGQVSQRNIGASHQIKNSNKNKEQERCGWRHSIIIIIIIITEVKQKISLIRRFPGSARSSFW